jgi:predicted nucleotidyltransferase
MPRKKTVEQALDEIVRRIVTTARPSKIVLFGSAALRAMGPHSDFGLLVVLASDQHRGKMAQKIYRSLIGVGYVTDIVVVTESDVAAYKDNVATLIQPALAEGKLLYDAWLH